MRRLGLALVLFLFMGGHAAAHPHVMVDVHVLVEFKQGKIVSLFLGWKFDPVYSASLFQDFDRNKNGRLEPEEIKAIETEAFKETRQQGYFTYAKAGDGPVTWQPASDFTVKGVKDSLLYAFRLALPEPVDPRKTGFSLTTFEESFYIDMDFPDGKAVTLTGEGSEGCSITIAPDKGNTIFGGMVTPKRASVTCG